MSDSVSQVSQSMHISAGVCSSNENHIYLYAGEVCLVFSHQEFLQLFQVVRDVSRELQEKLLMQEQQASAYDCQALASVPFFRPDDVATRLATVLSLLQGETNPARAQALQSVAADLDEEVRQEVRQWAHERAALLGTKKT